MNYIVRNTIVAILVMACASFAPMAFADAYYWCYVTVSEPEQPDKELRYWRYYSKVFSTPEHFDDIVLEAIASDFVKYAAREHKLAREHADGWNGSLVDLAAPPLHPPPKGWAMKIDRRTEKVLPSIYGCGKSSFATTYSEGDEAEDARDDDMDKHKGIGWDVVSTDWWYRCGQCEEYSDGWFF